MNNNRLFTKTKGNAKPKGYYLALYKDGRYEVGTKALFNNMFSLFDCKGKWERLLTGYVKTKKGYVKIYPITRKEYEEITLIPDEYFGRAYYRRQFGKSWEEALKEAQDNDYE